MDAIALGWFVVPGAIGSVLGSLVTLLWQHRAAKELRALESRLRKQEEAYRLAQSPRVAAAIELWSALCEYERCLGELFNPAKIVHVPPEASPQDWDALSEENERRLRREARRAWSAVAAPRDKAEVLLPATTFASFKALFNAYESAQGSHRMLTTWPLDEKSKKKMFEELRASVEEAALHRPKALLAVKGLLGDEANVGGAER